MSDIIRKMGDKMGPELVEELCLWNPLGGGRHILRAESAKLTRHSKIEVFFSDNIEILKIYSVHTYLVKMRFSTSSIIPLALASFAGFSSASPIINETYTGLVNVEGGQWTPIEQPS